MTEKSIIDWDDLSPEDQAKAMDLMNELNDLMRKYEKEEPKPCDDSISSD